MTLVALCLLWASEIGRVSTAPTLELPLMPDMYVEFWNDEVSTCGDTGRLMYHICLSYYLGKMAPSNFRDVSIPFDDRSYRGECCYPGKLDVGCPRWKLVRDCNPGDFRIPTTSPQTEPDYLGKFASTVIRMASEFRGRPFLFRKPLFP